MLHRHSLLVVAKPVSWTLVPDLLRKTGSRYNDILSCFGKPKGSFLWEERWLRQFHQYFSDWRRVFFYFTVIFVLACYSSVVTWCPFQWTEQYVINIARYWQMVSAPVTQSYFNAKSDCIFWPANIKLGLKGLNWLSTGTCGDGRPRVWLCHALLVKIYFFNALSDLFRRRSKPNLLFYQNL